MWKTRILALLVLVVGLCAGYFAYGKEITIFNKKIAPPAFIAKVPFKLGLDLSGGTRLVYRANVTGVPAGEVRDAMESVRDVVERRVNIFGVSEPLVQVESAGFTNGGEQRLVVELPGVTDVQKATEMIGQTPLLEFKTENPTFDPSKPIDATVGPDGQIKIGDVYKDRYVSTELTGRFLKKARVEFDPTTSQPTVSLEFDDRGSELFAQITRANVGKTVAIFLDGSPISTPNVREAITGGKAQISGTGNVKEAKQLVGRLNSGALPVPIELISTQTIGPSLGERAIAAGTNAGLVGLLAIALFLLVWYRLPGFIAGVALLLYIAVVLTVFKLFGVTLTAAGIAGFIISLGIAVDANILIFERIKEEIREGRVVTDAIHSGFDRAWLSIRDANFSTIITGLILFFVGTSLIKGFALTLIIGVVVSLFSAVLITRLFLFSLGIRKVNTFTSFLFGSGFSNARRAK